MAEPVTQEELDNMAASYRAQTGHLTRAVKAANVLVVEAALCAPSRVFLEQLKRVLAAVREQETKCAAICETSGMLKIRPRPTRLTWRGA
jgi:hypothetical protein